MAPALFLTLVLAQSAPVEGADRAQIERIRTALTETQAITIASSTRAQDSVFRVTVHGKPERPLWDAESATPSYVRRGSGTTSMSSSRRSRPRNFEARPCTQ